MQFLYKNFSSYSRFTYTFSRRKNLFRGEVNLMVRVHHINYQNLLNKILFINKFNSGENKTITLFQFLPMNKLFTTFYLLMILVSLAFTQTMDPTISLTFLKRLASHYPSIRYMRNVQSYVHSKSRKNRLHHSAWAHCEINFSEQLFHKVLTQDDVCDHVVILKPDRVEHFSSLELMDSVELTSLDSLMRLWGLTYFSRKSKTCTYHLLVEGHKEFFHEKKLKRCNSVIFSKIEIVNKKTFVQKIWWLMWSTLTIKFTCPRKKFFD